MTKIVKSKINQKLKLGIIGLGYVGLPLLLEFTKKRKVIGYDINENRIRELNEGVDSSQEFTYSEIKKTPNVIFTNSIDDLKL